jgi:ATP-binding cassette, subfamily B, bacterial MsbA
MTRMISDASLLKRLVAFVLPYRGRLIAGSLCLAFVSLIEPLVMIVFSRIIDRAFVVETGATATKVVTGQSQLAQSFFAPFMAWLDTIPVLWFPALLVVAFALRSVANFAGDVALHWVSSRVVFDLRQTAFAHLLRLPVSFFDKNATAELTSKLTFDAQQVGATCSQAITAVVQDSLKLVAAFVMLASVSWKLMLGVLVIAPVVAVVVRTLTRRLRAASEAIQRTMGELSRFTDEALSNQRTVKVFSAFSWVGEAFGLRANQVRRSLMKQETANAASAPLIHLVVSVAIAVIVALAIQEGQRGRMTAGDFFIFFTALLSLLPPLKSLSSVNGVIQRGLAAASSLFHVTDQAIETDSVVNRNDPRILERGRIEFRDVSFRYAERDVDALADVSFTVAANRHVALVGASGSGKSTVLSMLAGFYVPSAGVILLDDVAIAELGLANLRASISMVSQDVLLINDSVAKNIAFGATSDFNIERVKAASVAAGADQFIAALPNGYNTNVGEGGGLLSGGQRQRVAIARAFYKNAPIVLFDEATSALDSESEQIVQSSLKTLGQGRTIIQIAHRLSSVRGADEIFVFDQGRIVEHGTHAALVHRNGVYANLIRRQAA